MTGIFPSTEVHLLSGCPIEKNHGNTIFFTSLTEQINYFSSFDMRVFYNISYQRENKNVFRIECPIAEVINCNYMMFKNDAFENKWFYAFIDKINYINNQTTEIEYTIDVLQTWYFNFDFHQSFVEREHVLNDKIGANIVQENVSIGEYTTSHITKITPYSNSNKKYTAIIYYIPNRLIIDSYSYTPLGDYSGALEFRCYLSEAEVSEIPDFHYNRKGIIENNIYEGFNTVTCEIDTTSETTIKQSKTILSSLISGIIKAAPAIIIGGTTSPATVTSVGGNIVDIVIVPSSLVNSSGHYTQNYKIIEPNMFKNPAYSQSYTPKNNKLFCYPFQKVVVSNNNGELKELMWENSDEVNMDVTDTTPAIILKLDTVLLPSAGMNLMPINYKNEAVCYASSSSLNPSVSCTWSEDSFTRWFNTHKSQIASSIIADSVKTAFGGFILSTGKGKIIGAQNAISGSTGVMGTLASINDKINTPDEMFGSLSEEGLKIIQDRMGFYVYSVQIKAPQAKIIDDFFTMYGYQVNELKIPNVFNPSVFSRLRPYWNYVKTQNAVITPKVGMGLPAEAEQKICEIFNNGITFWNPTATVGDYSQNNAPVI